MQARWSEANSKRLQAVQSTNFSLLLFRVQSDENMQSAGGIFMSISDLGRWLNLNMNSGKLGGKQIVSADLVRIPQTGYTKSPRNEPPLSGDGEDGLAWSNGEN